MIREIPRLISMPVLSSKKIDLISQLCFRPDDKLEKSDVLFAFSTSVYQQKLASIVCNVIDSNLVDNVILTGGVIDFNDVKHIPIPEWKQIYDLIDIQKYNHINFIIEKESTNTLSNVLNAFDVFDLRSVNNLIYIFKSYASRRGYLTLRRYLPKTHLMQVSYDVRYDNSNDEINIDNWYTNPINAQRVWGEVVRIKTYGERGDIEYEEIRDTMDKIIN